MSSQDPKKAIKRGNGTATLKTVSGGTLKVTTMQGKNIILSDEKGAMARVTIADVNQSLTAA